MNKLYFKCGLPNEFSKCSKSKDGLKSACKIYLRTQAHNYMTKQRFINSDKINQRMKEWLGGK